MAVCDNDAVSHIIDATLLEIDVIDREGLWSELEIHSRVCLYGAWAIRKEKSRRRPVFNDRSQLDLFVGRVLPTIYSKYFGRDPGISRMSDGVTPTGPYVRFVEQVLTELDFKNGGKPYTRAAIDRAFRNERAGKVRRKKS